MIIPAGCKILVKPFTMEEDDPIIKRWKALGGSINEDSERRQQVNIDKGVVLAIGPSVSQEYVKGLEVGDTIGFARFGGKYISEPNKPDEKLLILNDEDVICYFKD